MIFAFQKEVSYRNSVDKRLKIVHIAFKILSCQCCYVIVNFFAHFVSNSGTTLFLYN